MSLLYKWIVPCHTSVEVLSRPYQGVSCRCCRCWWCHVRLVWNYCHVCTRMCHVFFVLVRVMSCHTSVEPLSYLYQGLCHVCVVQVSSVMSLGWNSCHVCTRVCVMSVLYKWLVLCHTSVNLRVSCQQECLCYVCFVQVSGVMSLGWNSCHVFQGSLVMSVLQLPIWSPVAVLSDVYATFAWSTCRVHAIFVKFVSGACDMCDVRVMYVWFVWCLYRIQVMSVSCTCDVCIVYVLCLYHVCVWCVYCVCVICVMSLSCTCDLCCVSIVWVWCLYRVRVISVLCMCDFCDVCVVHSLNDELCQECMELLCMKFC